MHSLSLRQLTLRYTGLIFAIFLSLAVTAYFVFGAFAREHEDEEISRTLRLKARNIAFLVDFYRNVIEQIAAEPGTLDLMMFASPGEAQQWAVSKQKLLPKNIGLALVSPQGEVLGNPLALRIGERCLSDLRAHIGGESIGDPPVHTRVSGLEHFDLIANIRDESAIVGAVFASFSLITLQAELERMVEAGQQLELYAGDGSLLAGAGRVPTTPTLHTQVLSVAGTDWTMKAMVEQRDYSPLWSELGMAGGAIFLLTIPVLYLYARRLNSIFATDLQAIEKLLAHLKDKPAVQRPAINSRLSETGSIMRNIEHLADDIARNQSRLIVDSNTDELTGLYNRRAFKQAADRYFALSRRGVRISVVALDMDYLKAANDNFGHETGDRLLQALADCLRTNTRSTDTTARIGGDEFVVMMVQSEAHSIFAWFDKLSAAFLQRQREILPATREPARHCSLSAGLAEVCAQDNSIEDAIKRADAALYSAKGAGRGRMRAWSDGA